MEEWETWDYYTEQSYEETYVADEGGGEWWHQEESYTWYEEVAYVEEDNGHYVDYSGSSSGEINSDFWWLFA